MADLAGSRVALFVPCYVDQLAPQVGLAALEVLRRAGVDAEFPVDQACCGQPLVNVGWLDEARPLAARYARVFRGYDYIVCPSGSCTAMVRHGYATLLEDRCSAEVGGRTFELCEFLVGVAGVKSMRGHFDRRVGLHRACHGLRGLRLGACSERAQTTADAVVALLGGIDGLALVEPPRRDECCGFGGSFSVDEPEISALMGRDCLRGFDEVDAEVITSTDVSCLLHLDGLARRGDAARRTIHVAEILADCEPLR